MREAHEDAKLLEERARKREAIGLSPKRPTAKIVVHSPPEARKGFSPILLVLLVTALLAIVWVTWRETNNANFPFAGGSALPAADQRLIVRDEFREPQFALPVRSNGASTLSYEGEFYQIRLDQPGELAWATLGQKELGAYKVETDLRLATQEEYAWGYGGVVVRYQNDDNFYLFVADNYGKFQVQLVENGAWRTVQPWTASGALSEGRQNLLSVSDDGAALRFLINDAQVALAADPQLPTGDVGLIVGARSRGKAKGLFDWVALYEIPLYEIPLQQ